MRALMYVMCIYIDVIMYKYGIQNMYDDGEYFQNILLRKSKPNANNNNFKSYVFLSHHAMKNLQFVTLNCFLLKACYMMTCHFNPCHITLGLHNIHINFFKLQIT
jgi:hypothetical protein